MIAGSIEIQLMANLARLSQDMDKAQRTVGGAMKSIESSVNLAKTAFKGLVGGIGLMEIGKAVDAYTKFDAQLKLASKSASDYAASYASVIRIAKTSQSDLESVGTLYARLTNGLRDLGTTQADISKISEAVALSLKVSGATAQETSSVMLQLSQAFGAGRLNGAEFNAMAEGSPILLRQLAKTIGVTYGELKQLGADGKLTAEVMTQAFTDQKYIDGLREQAKEVATLSGGFVTLKNEIFLATGEMDKQLGASKGLAKVLIDLANSGFIKGFFQALALSLAYAGYGFTAITTTASAFLIIMGKIASLDFKGAVDIGDALKDAARKAREELDKTTAAIMNPAATEAIVERAKTQAEIDAEKARRDAEAAAKAKANEEERLKAAKKLAEQIEKDDKEAQARTEARFAMQQEFEGKTTKFYNMLAKIKKDDDKEENERKLKNMELWQKATEKRYADEREELEKVAKQQEETARDINRSLTDALLRGFEKGKTFAQNFRDTLVNMFQTLILRPTIEAVINGSGINKLIAGVTGSVASVFSGGAAAGGSTPAASGGFSFGDAFTGVKTLFSDTASSLISGIEGLGANIANGLGGIRDTIGGFIGANSSAIAQTLPYAGALLQLAQGNVKGAAFSAAGVAIGNAIVPVIGGVIGGIIGSFAGSLFGKKKIPLSSSQSSGTYTGGKFAPTSEGFFGKKNLGIASNLSGLNETFSRSLGGLLNNFGLNDRVGSTSEINSRTNVRGSFGANFDGGSVVYGTKFGKAKRTSIEQAFNQLTDQVLGPLLVEAIQKSKLPEGIRALFNGVSDKTQVANLINATVTLNASQAELASRFGITVDQSAKAAKSTGLVGQALIDYVNKLANTATSFQTLGDQLVKFRTGLEDVYGGSLPATLKAYDEAIKGVDKSTQAGIDSFVELFGIREQFAQFTASIDGLKGNVRGALFGMVSDAEKQQMLNADLAKLFGDLGRDVPGSIQELLALGKSIDYTTAEGLNLAAVFPSLVTAFNQTQTAVDELINSLNPNRFRTFFDFAVASSYQRQGIPLSQLPVANMPSYAVGTDYVPNDGPAMIHQGERIIPASQNASLASDSKQMVSLLSTLVSKVAALEYDMGRAADGAQRTARELEDISSGDVILQTEAA
jgi:tape measure domain-containing protein